LETLVYQDVYITCTLAGGAAKLSYYSEHAAGAIGKAQGESWELALDSLKNLSSDQLQTLHLTVNSAGAHFGEPMEGLFHLNVIAESLWELRNQGVRISVECPGWLYGGMAMVLASVAHEIVLHPQAHMGLFGPKVLGENVPGSIPAVGTQPDKLSLLRLPE
jgi:acetyl-CoA carboxylase beta subunit